MLETKSLVGDLDAGRKLTGEALWRRDARLAKSLRTSPVSWRGLLLRIDYFGNPRGPSAILFNLRLSETLPRPMADAEPPVVGGPCVDA